jgi:hypothetical protein
VRMEGGATSEPFLGAHRRPGSKRVASGFPARPCRLVAGPEIAGSDSDGRGASDWGRPSMNAVDYILDAVLLVTVFLQFRGRRLTPRNLALPVGIVIYFLFAYLKGVPTAGNDLYLTICGVVLGLIFGVGAGAFTRVYLGDKGIYARAGLLAAAFWTVGVVGRTAFSLYATDGGSSADRTIGHLMHTYDITTSKAIVACLLLMVLVEVGARQLIVGVRYLNLRHQMSSASPSPLTGAASGPARP